VSEGRRRDVLAGLSAEVGSCLLDVHRDEHHHRSVLTLAGPPATLEEAVRRLVSAAVERLDLRAHQGAHPRFGVVDVVPFVPLGRGLPVSREADLAPAVAARDRFANWATAALGLPCVLYGPLPTAEVRTLPEARRLMRGTVGHATAGVTAVGARPVLVAYNLWLDADDLALAERVAGEVRGPSLRALGFRLGSKVQVSCNLIDPWRLGPGRAHDEIAARLQGTGVAVARGELVGLLPREVLHAVDPDRWGMLGLAETSTIESHLERLGVVGTVTPG
jgi:glutamate formiminotransferase / 5-formyltetrahydrofolate cyclo-ligase